MTSPIRTERHGDVLVVVCDSPPVNAMGAAVRAGLEAAVRQGVADASIAAMVIRCDGRTFFAGADIGEFGRPFADPGFSQVMDTIAAADKPVVAAIHGTALGAGCELALACHYRVAVRSAKLGTPEVTLGLLPGAGGTQRLPRLVGVPLALRMVALGETIAAPAAVEAGLVDRIVGDDLAADAIAFANEMAARRPLPRASDRVAAPDPETIADFRAAHADAFRGFDAPEANVACIERASDGSSYDEGIAFEHHAFARLMAGTQATAQRHLFFAERQAAKIDGMPAGTTPRPVGKVGIVGTGPLADGIAGAFAARRLPVAVVPTPDRDALAGCELVIVAGAADLFKRLDAACGPGTILATGAGDLDALAAATGRPGDVVSLDFQPAAAGAELVEVTRGAATAPDVLAAAMAVGRKVATVAIAVAAPGHVAPRLLTRQAEAAAALVAAGVGIEKIDAAYADFGMATGPFAPGGSVTDRSPSAATEAIDDAAIVERTLYPVIDEAARILAEGGVQRAGDLDLIGVHSLGWPAYRGGPMFWGESQGWDRIAAALERHGIAPSPALRALADRRAMPPAV